MPPTLRVTFHGIGPTTREVDAGERKVWLETASFERALDAIAPAARPTITFDDGNMSDIEIALPRLVERGMTAVFFVCAGRIGDHHFLDVGHMRQLLDAGMTIGSHGMDHVPWRGLDAQGLRLELEESRSRLEDALGVAVEDAACPFGSYDRTVLRAAKRAGYRRVFTSDGIGPPIGGWLYPRTTITEEVLSTGRMPGLVSAPLLGRTGCVVRSFIKSWR